MSIDLNENNLSKTRIQSKEIAAPIVYKVKNESNVW